MYIWHWKQVFIHKEYGDLNVVVDDVEITRILKKRTSQTFYKLIDVHTVTNAIGEIVLQ